MPNLVLFTWSTSYLQNRFTTLQALTIWLRLLDIANEMNPAFSHSINEVHRVSDKSTLSILSIEWQAFIFDLARDSFSLHRALIYDSDNDNNRFISEDNHWESRKSTWAMLCMLLSERLFGCTWLKKSLTPIWTIPHHSLWWWSSLSWSSSSSSSLSLVCCYCSCCSWSPLSNSTMTTTIAAVIIIKAAGETSTTTTPLQQKLFEHNNRNYYIPNGSHHTL